MLTSESPNTFPNFLYLKHAIRTKSEACSKTLHSQFYEGVTPHLCMDKSNRSTSVRRRLSLTQSVQGKLNPTGLVVVMGMKSRCQDLFTQYFVFHLKSVNSYARMTSQPKLINRFCAAGTK